MSDGHRHSVYQLQSIREAASVENQLVKHSSIQQGIARRCLQKIFSSTRFLLRQGLAFRGHSSTEGNFIQLLKTLSEDNNELQNWLKRDTAFTSPLIQNEIIDIFGNGIRDVLTRRVLKAGNYALIVDGTRDASGLEQESICFRFVDDDLKPVEVFFGLYTPKNTKGSTIAETVKEILKKSGIPLSACRAQTYDGAANMKGDYNGCQAIIKQENDLAIYIHCGAHSSNLVAGEVANSSPELKEAMMAVTELGKLSSRSGKFKQLFLEQKIDGASIKPICPSRFLCRRPAISGALNQHKAVLTSLGEFAKTARDDQAARVIGIRKSLESGKTHLMLKIALTVFSILENLNVCLQSRTATIEKMLEVVDLARRDLKNLRCENAFGEIYSEVAKMVEEGLLDEIEMPRARRKPARFEEGSTSCDSNLACDLYYRRIYYIIIDTALNDLQKRFDINSEGLIRYRELENALLKKYKTSTTLKVLEKYPELKAKKTLDRIRFLHEEHPNLKSVEDVVEVLRNMHSTTREYFKDAENLVRLILVIPVSSCEAERSLSALRRLKTWLRSTMNQDRLCSVAISHVHKDILTDLDLKHLLKLFVNNSDSRLRVFGQSSVL